MTVTYKEVVTKTTKIDEVKCNCCAELIYPSFEYIEVCHHFGYNSDYDGDTVQFELCEGCLFKIISSFKIPAHYKSE